jgi:hypothetical protein
VIGSRKVTEGYNILSVNNAFVLQMPYNIPKLLQVIGRNKSHARLPATQQYVNVHLLVNTLHKGNEALQ